MENKKGPSISAAKTLDLLKQQQFEDPRMWRDMFNDPRLHAKMRRCDNYFAQYLDTENDYWMIHLSLDKFVPTHDGWCLACHQDCKKRCKKCKSVFFCNMGCRSAVMDLHKKYCGRDLFANCSACGIEVKAESSLKCDTCPVRFCSEKCQTQMMKRHKEEDCNYFSKAFPSENPKKEGVQ